MAAGGNAVDGAIAAIAAQGVVAPETCGLGGDLFALVHRPGWGPPRTLNASGRSGSFASADDLRRLGAEEVPGDHPLTVTIPGCVDGMTRLSAQLGRLPLADCLAPAIELAAEGFEATAEQASAFDRMAPHISRNPAVAEFYPNGSAVKRGDHVARPNLARTLNGIAIDGRAAFYEGQPGKDIVEAVGGLITLDDLRAAQAEWIEPIGVEVADLTAWTVPPNSQGYLGPATLAVYEMLDTPDDPEDPLAWHLLIESYRALAWERDDLVSDPEWTQLPPDLLMDRRRLERVASTVSGDVAGIWPKHIGSTAGTSYLCTADSEGTSVSMIQSNYRGIGSPFGAANSGFMLQDRGGGFGLVPGHPNELGPNKRPLHTLSPTLWTENSTARWIVGCRGGAVQPQLIAQIGLRAILGGTDLLEALAAPRWTISNFAPGSPPVLEAEPEIAPRVVNELASRGHSLSIRESRVAGWGPVSVIGRDNGVTVAGADPRVETATALLF